MTDQRNDYDSLHRKTYERILHLNLKKKWFDMILSGKKTEEYREVKPFFDRLFRPFDIRIHGKWCSRKTVQIMFSNGYAKDRRQMLVNIRAMRFHSEGKPEWGAEKGVKYYVLVLGKVTPINC